MIENILLLQFAFHLPSYICVLFGSKPKPKAASNPTKISTSEKHFDPSPSAFWGFCFMELTVFLLIFLGLTGS